MGGRFKYLPSKQGCLAFSQLKLLGEMVVVKLERGVLVFYHYGLQIVLFFVTTCRVMLSVLIILTKSEANLNGVLFLPILIGSRHR